MDGEGGGDITNPVVPVDSQQTPRDKESQESPEQLQKSGSVTIVSKQVALASTVEENTAVDKHAGTKPVNSVVERNEMEEKQDTIGPVNCPEKLQAPLIETSVQVLEAAASVGNLKESAAVGNVEAPATVGNVEEPAAVRNVEEPAAIGNVEAPVNAVNVKEPVTVGNNEEPAAVGIVEVPESVKNVPDTATVGNGNLNEAVTINNQKDLERSMGDDNHNNTRTSPSNNPNSLETTPGKKSAADNSVNENPEIMEIDITSAAEDQAVNKKRVENDSANKSNPLSLPERKNLSTESVADKVPIIQNSGTSSVGTGPPNMACQGQENNPGTSAAAKALAMAQAWKQPNFPSAPLSTTSVASSALSASLSMRKRRLPPPPPLLDWTDSSKSMLGKRQGSSAGSFAKRRFEDIDLESSISVKNEPPPRQNKVQLEKDKRGVLYLKGHKMSPKLTFDSLVLGRKMGEIKPETYVDTTFCNREILEYLMEVKYDIRKAGPPAYYDMQSKMNDFASPPTVFQFNDAYVYANLDALTNFSITDPCDHKGTSIVFSDLMHVLDIHGGPGGFVEYMLTKKQWDAKVYGFTLRESSYNYKLQPTGHFPMESFQQWYGWDGVQGDGNIYRPDYVEVFHKYLMRNTDFKGVHVVVAGGQEVTPGLDEDMKELRCKNLFLAEVLIALKALRDGGTFVLRLYDIFTPFTAGLVYLLYRVFGRIAIVRPEACLHGSAERFLVCKHYIGSQHSLATEVINYLANLHGTNYSCRSNPKDNNEVQAEIVELVPTDTITENEEFYNYLRESNIKIGNQQLEETKLMVRSIQFKHNGRIERNRKNTIIQKCAEVWNCPAFLRQRPRFGSLPLNTLSSNLLRPYPEDMLSRAERGGELEMTYSRMDKEFVSPDQWHCVSVGRDRGFYMSRGGDQVYRFTEGEWKLAPESLVLADETLVYGDFVDEVDECFQGKGRQYIRTSFHIIDGLILGGKDIRNLGYIERMEMCSKFGKSMNNPSVHQLCLIRAKTPREATEIETILKAVVHKEVKGSGEHKMFYVTPITDRTYFASTGYLFLRTVKPDGDGNLVADDFLGTMQNRLYWKLGDKTSRDPTRPPKVPERPNAIVDPHTMARTVNCFLNDAKRVSQKNVPVQ